MALGTTTREQLQAELPWKPIRGCPGRLVLVGLSERSIEELAGVTSPASVRTSKMARDPVVIVQLVDGGLISYVKPDGRYLHTLATPEAFERKVRQIGLEAHPAEVQSHDSASNAEMIAGRSAVLKRSTARGWPSRPPPGHRCPTASSRGRCACRFGSTSR